MSMADSNGPAWDAATSGTRTSYLNSNGLVTRTHDPDRIPNGYFYGNRGMMSDSTSHDVGGKYHDGDSSFVAGGGALRRSNASAGLGKSGKWAKGERDRPASPLGPRPGLAQRLSEDLSVDGWSVESRNADDRGCGGSFRRGTRSNRHFCAFDADDDDYDLSMEDEDVEEASVPGFVFDRGDGGVEGSEVVEGVEGGGVGEGDAGDEVGMSLVTNEGGDVIEGSGYTKDGGDERPSASTAPMSSSAAECTLGCKEAPDCTVAREGVSTLSCSIGVGRNGGAAAGVCSPCGEAGDSHGVGDGLGEVGHEGKDGILWEGPRKPLRQISNGHHRSGSLAEVLVSSTVAVVEDAAEGGGGGGGESERRPRGESWPQNIPLSRTELKANPGNGGSPRAKDERPRGPSAFPDDSRRQDWRRGALERGARHFPGRGRWRTRPREDIYDLWLYIQMQYCSHNNLQYFLEENPERLAQTRVDMPQVSATVVWYQCEASCSS